MYLRQMDLAASRANMLMKAATSGHLVDDAGLVDLSNHLVETAVTTTARRQASFLGIIAACDVESFVGLYCRLWLQSKYDSTSALLETIQSTTGIWVTHESLGRVIGGFVPIFQKTPEWPEYLTILSDSQNHGVRDAYKFHKGLATDIQIFQSMYDSLRNPNPSRGTGITHAKFLCLLSALQNAQVPPAQLTTLKIRNFAAWRDVYYRRMARRLSIELPRRLHTIPKSSQNSTELPTAAQ